MSGPLLWVAGPIGQNDLRPHALIALLACHMQVVSGATHAMILLCVCARAHTHCVRLCSAGGPAEMNIAIAKVFPHPGPQTLNPAFMLLGILSQEPFLKMPHSDCGPFSEPAI